MKGVTSYRGIAKYYFLHLLNKIIKLGELDTKDCSILDFGCGENQLQKILGEKVVGYDIIEELTDIDDWKKAQFDTLVANQVFYSFDERQLSSLMDQLSQYNNDITIIVGISRQGLFNNIGKVIFGNKNAHSLTKITPKEELAILLQHCNLIRKNNILYLTDLYLLKLK